MASQQYIRYMIQNETDNCNIIVDSFIGTWDEGVSSSREATGIINAMVGSEWEGPKMLACWRPEPPCLNNPANHAHAMQEHSQAFQKTHKTTPLSKDRAQESGPSQLPCACWLSVPWAGSAKSAVPPEMYKLSSGVPPPLQSLQHTFLAALEIAVRNVPSSKPLIASCNEIHSRCLQYYVIFLYAS